jgi:putative transposase
MLDAVGLRILLVALAGWVNRHQLEVIEYLRDENRVLKEHLDGRRLRLTDAQRRRLAANGHRLGRHVLREVATLVTPDTILRWHRQLIARKWTTQRRRAGRPGVLREIGLLIVRMARENPTWGYRRIQGALKNLDHRVARSTVAKVFRAHGMGPVPERPTSWRTFLAAHWGIIAAADFFTTEVWTASRILICDRDTKWSAAFRQTLADVGIRVVQTPFQAPNCEPGGDGGRMLDYRTQPA